MLLLYLKVLDIKVKDAQKKLGKKFACGASVIENDVIEIQGDIADDALDYLLQEYPTVLFAKQFFKPLDWRR